MENALENDEHIYDRMLEKKRQIEHNPEINRRMLDMEFANLKNNYQIFMKSKALIISYLYHTVENIQKYIKNSSIKLPMRYEHFEPRVLSKIGFESSVSKNRVDFNSDLLKEYPFKKLVDFYHANGIVKEEDLRKGLLPSELLKSLNLGTEFNAISGS